MLQSSYHDFAIACNTGYQTTTPLFQLTTLFATFSSLVVKMLLWQPKHANYKSLIIKFFKIELNIEVVGFELKILLPTKILFDRLINIYLSFFYEKDPRKKNPKIQINLNWEQKESKLSIHERWLMKAIPFIFSFSEKFHLILGHLSTLGKMLMI